MHENRVFCKRRQNLSHTSYVAGGDKYCAYETIAKASGGSVFEKAQYLSKAFTLAEVLIVLGIIGLIADMTIPTLQQNIQKKVLQTQFQKSYSILSQALVQAKTELGVDNLYSYYVNYDKENNVYINAGEFIDAFYRQLRARTKVNYKVHPRNYNNTAQAYWHAAGIENPIQVLPDGSSVHCMINAGQIFISVDINGPLKKPNKTGHDIFLFYVNSKDSLQPNKPSTVHDDNEFISGFPCNKSSVAQGNGIGCAYYAMIDKNPDDETKSYWDNLP